MKIRIEIEPGRPGRSIELTFLMYRYLSQRRTPNIAADDTLVSVATVYIFQVVQKRMLDFMAARSTYIDRIVTKVRRFRQESPYVDRYN